MEWECFWGDEFGMRWPWYISVHNFNSYVEGLDK